MPNPESVVYSIGRTEAGWPCVIITSQQIDWDAKPLGEPSTTRVTIEDIQQLVGFCIRCGDKELFEAVRRPFLSR
jgi:hypothetical protein